MLLREIPRDCEPDHSSDQSDQCADPKGPSPAVVENDIGDQARGDACSSAYAGKINPVAIPRSRDGIQLATNLLLAGFTTHSRTPNRKPTPEEQTVRRQILSARKPLEP